MSPSASPPKTPRVSVVLTVYNGQQHLKEAVASILAQDFTDFELVAVNDGSTDRSSQILHDFAKRDARVRVIDQENRGIAGAANRGIEEATAPLIARMDADDISMPQRFGLQVDYLDKHPECLAVGTAILNIDADGDPLNISIYESDPERIDDCLMHRRTGMAQPSVMMRRDIVLELGGYRKEYEWIEDHDLWLRLAERGPLGNLPDVMLCYRQHLGSVSWNNASLRMARINGVLTDAYRRRDIPIPAGLLLPENPRRSTGGHHKFLRAAVRAGQWKTARKHFVAQWAKHPLSAITWRCTMEAGFRAVSTVIHPPPAAPIIPRFSADFQ